MHISIEMAFISLIFFLSQTCTDQNQQQMSGVKKALTVHLAFDWTFAKIRVNPKSRVFTSQFYFFYFLINLFYQHKKMSQSDEEDTGFLRINKLEVKRKRKKLCSTWKSS